MFKKLGATGLNGLMAILLLGMLALPLSSIGLAGVKTKLSSIGASSSEVLSAQDAKDMQGSECVCPELVITPDMEREIFERLLREEEELEMGVEEELVTEGEALEEENGGVAIQENSL